VALSGGSLLGARPRPLLDPLAMQSHTPIENEVKKKNEKEGTHKRKSQRNGFKRQAICKHTKQTTSQPTNQQTNKKGQTQKIGKRKEKKKYK